VIFSLLVFAIAFADEAAVIVEATNSYVAGSFGWLYSLVVTGGLVFVVSLAHSRFGDMVLGPDDAVPDFSTVSWLAMLFSAGMGIGLLFFGVAEPIEHFLAPPAGATEGAEAANNAIEIAIFHWGLHGWALYCVIGISLAYFSFRKGLPLAIRSALSPMLGERTEGPIGHLIDVFAVVCTLFGIATSLGLGAMQVNAGLNYTLDIDVNRNIQVIIIISITICATVSVASGLGKGIKFLSLFNIFCAIGLLIFVLFVGPTSKICAAFVQNIGNYFTGIFQRSFDQYVLSDRAWMSSWTTFYWGWWIAWCPFVGLFLARISRGRKIKEFIYATLGVPIAVTILWFSVFGNSALFAYFSGDRSISNAVSESLPTAIFALLENLPYSSVSSLIAIVLIVSFFVTSSDSGSFVIDVLTSGGALDPPIWSRVFWALLEGVVAATLLYVGGLHALQTATIVAALPFSAVVVAVMYCLCKELMADEKPEGQIQPSNEVRADQKI